VTKRCGGSWSRSLVMPTRHYVPVAPELRLPQSVLEYHRNRASLFRDQSLFRELRSAGELSTGEELPSRGPGRNRHCDVCMELVGSFDDWARFRWRSQGTLKRWD
jgi:hypothetical protein